MKPKTHTQITRAGSCGPARERTDLFSRRGGAVPPLTRRATAIQPLRRLQRLAPRT